MNKFNVVSLIALAIVATGCAHNSAPPATPNNPDDNSPAMGEPPARPSSQCPSCENDGFAKTGTVIADSSRWIWDESKKAYRYLTSEEMKERAEKAYREAVSLSRDADASLQAAIKAWRDSEKADANKK